MITLSCAFIQACDCQNTRKCEWKIEKDPKNMDMASNGFVSVCIKNYSINRQKCILEIEESRLNQVLNKTFVYRDIEIDSNKMPRRITSFKECKP
ncbi:MAG: hypothetical protein HRU09_11025 [Oligoflexales bacterium]|nr:hypothetical protein [Oligoflexales bacterium]